jgi:hypothetical protein
VAGECISTFIGDKAKNADKACLDFGDSGSGINQRRDGL